MFLAQLYLDAIESSTCPWYSHSPSQTSLELDLPHHPSQCPRELSHLFYSLNKSIIGFSTIECVFLGVLFYHNKEWTIEYVNHLNNKFPLWVLLSNKQREQRQALHGTVQLIISTYLVTWLFLILLLMNFQVWNWAAYSSCEINKQMNRLWEMCFSSGFV